MAEPHHHKSHSIDKNEDDSPHIYHGIDLRKVNISTLPKNQQEHLMMHEKHRGHESMHAAMLLILISATVLAQILLIFWRRKNFKSYQNVSMFGMWIIPLIISVYNQYWRFVFIWSVITIVTLLLIFRPLFYKNFSGGSSIPRQVYQWFFSLYSISSVIAVTGYTILMLTLLGVNLLLGIKPTFTLDVGILLLFYGIYYGVLTRDFTDFLVDKLAANIGYYSPSSSLPSKQLNSKTCAICGRPHNGGKMNRGLSNDDQHLYDNDDHHSRSNLLSEYVNYENNNNTNNNNDINNINTSINSINCSNGGRTNVDSSLQEKTYTLTCGHTFHQYCIFGWCLVGKKQLCPFCREKVDLKKTFSSLPFQKPHYLYGNLLDFIRYFIAWQPVILFTVQCVNYVFGLE